MALTHQIVALDSGIKHLFKSNIMPKITVIIPARNEEKTIEEIIKIVQTSNLADELIVVDSFSKDRTAEIAKKMGVKLIESKELGKAEAMKTGAENAFGDILLFLDADLTGLASEHLQKLVQPLLEGKAAMCVGLRDYRGGFFTYLMKNFAFLIGGERAIFASHFRKISGNKLAKGFNIETVMNVYCRKNKLPIKKVVLKNLAQRSKMKKQGFFKGTIANQRMFLNIAFVHLRLMFQQGVRVKQFKKGN